jgi:hypothetical protein
MLATALGVLPALPLHTAGKYVAGAYIVLFALVLIYVAIMAIRLCRIERDLGELLSMSEGRGPDAGGPEAGDPEVGGSERSAEHDPQPESTPA